MKKVYLFLLFCLFNCSYGYINIYPTEFNKNIKEGVTESFKLYNRTERAVKYRVYLEGDGSDEDMSKWIEVYPQSISLNPLEEEELRISVTPPENIKSGNYRAKLVIKEVEVPKSKKKEGVKFMTIFKLKMRGYIL